MPIGKVKDATTGWQYQGALDRTLGYVINDLRHDQHRFAHEIFVALVMVQSHDGRTETFQLGTGNVNVQIVNGPATRSYTPKREKAPLGHYTVRFKVSTTYKIHGLFGEPNQTLFIEQATLFTRYVKDPAHEPGGILKASRLYPLIRVSSPPPSARLSKPGSRIAAIRVFQVLGFSLAGRTSRNQAGVWADLDIPGTGGRGPGAVAFARAEKPLMIEIVGDGLEGNTNFVMSVARSDWDNIHQWNGTFSTIKELQKVAYGPGARLLPPSPGMPYAAHQHWRWGAIATYYLPIVATGGGRQFRGIRGTRGGALVDGKMPNQSLSFAIAVPPSVVLKLGQTLRAGKFRFNDPLEKLVAQSTPALLWQGEPQLNHWIDVTARSNHIDEAAPYTRAMATEFKGTLFAHGVFFAHEGASVMPASIALAVPGAYKPQFIPKVPLRQWNRP